MENSHSLRDFWKIFLQNFTYLCPCSVFVAVHGFLQLQDTGFSLWWLLLLQSTGSGVQSLQQLWCVGFIALWQVESSQTRDQTRVACIGWLILNHWANREVRGRTFPSTSPNKIRVCLSVSLQVSSGFGILILAYVSNTERAISQCLKERCIGLGIRNKQQINMLLCFQLIFWDSKKDLSFSEAGKPMSIAHWQA